MGSRVLMVRESVLSR